MVRDPFQARLPTPEQVKANVEAGLWTNRPLPLDVRRVAATAPGREAVVDSLGRTTYGELIAWVDNAIAGLESLGVGRGDRIAVQLPNWHPFVVIHLALDALGAVIVPIPLIYRAKEVEFLLSFTEAKVVVIPSEFRGFDYRAMIAHLRPTLPALEHVVVVQAQGAATFPPEVPYASLIASSGGQAERPALGDASQVVEIAFTSGSAGDPKGVMLTANAIAADGETIASACSLTERSVFFMASPLGHQLGFSVGLRMPLSLGAKVVYLDHWNPEDAVELMARENVTFTCSTPTLLIDVLRARNLQEHRALPALEVWLLAGAVATAALHEEARAKLPGVALAHVFSMTEVGAVIINPPGAPPDRSLATGRAPRGVELKVLGPNGEPVGRGTEGELVIRTHSLFAGYYRRNDLTDASFTPDGFFRSGDTVRIDDQGYLSVTGRIKDLIKRGGESISPAELEEILIRHPKVADVAIVGIPDPRLGERVCACIVPFAGETLTLDEVVAWVSTAQVAKQKWPEQLELFSALPRTSIGKVHKGELREMVARKPTDGAP